MTPLGRHMFAIAPSAIFLLAAPIRVVQLYKKNDKIRWLSLKAIKMATIIVYCLLKLSLLILWTLHADLRSKATIAAGAFDLASAILTGLLSPVEHAKSSRPSPLINVFLLSTALLDGARARTEWLILQQASVLIPSMFIASLIVKILLLVFESIPKRHHVLPPSDKQTPEVTSGIFGLSLLAWLNPLIVLGNRGNISLLELFPVDEHIASVAVDTKLQAEWKLSSKNKSYSLALAMTRALWLPLSVTMIPRFFLVGFLLAQPFLIENAVHFVENTEDTGNYVGYGLIGASMLDIMDTSVEKSSAVTLMGTEVERIVATLQHVISIAPDFIQVGLAVWILEIRLGPICVAPIIMALISAIASAQVAKLIRPRQRRWMQAIQKRVGVTSQVIGSIKSMKMLGLTAKMTKIVQNLRVMELHDSKKFRQVQITNIILGNAPGLLSPVVTFMGFAIIIKLSNGDLPNTATIFSSLSLLSILINPVNELTAALPNLTAALDCFNRIQEYIMADRRIDYRTIKSTTSGRSDIFADNSHTASLPDVDYNTKSPKSEDNAETMVTTQVPAVHVQNDPAIIIDHVDAGWSKDVIVLHDLLIQIRPTRLTMIVGDVGCGKSSILRLLLGEIVLIKGSVTLSTDDIAYCNQTPFLTNQSIRKSIIGAREYDEEWYHRCVHACALDVDLKRFASGDNTVVGSKGIALSGGQKQRLALARAAYARKNIVLLDDVLSGLDAETEHQCFGRLLGPDGLFRRSMATIVLVTHSVKWLPYSDQVIAMSHEGRILQSGSYETLVLEPGYIQNLQLQKTHQIAPPSGTDHVPEKNEPVSASQTNESNSATNGENRGKRDFSNLNFYISSMGRTSFFLFVSLVGVEVVLTALQPLWLNWWVQAYQEDPNLDLGMWAGVYALFGVLGLCFLGLSGGAPLDFFTLMDTGAIVNRFSQDMTLVDMSLPMALLLATERFGNSIAEAVLTCVASGYMAISLPFLAATLYYLQNAYLRTSRQIRLLDLEAKSPLYTHFTESLQGLHTIRAFAWSEHLISQNTMHLDISQRPFYLLLCLQRWLNLVLDLIVAALAIILMSLAVALRHSMNTGLLGVAMVSIVNFGQTLSYFITYWTMLETSLGAIARTKQYMAETPSEEVKGAQNLPPDWPSESSIEICDVSASYRNAGREVLTDVSLSIPAGQRLAICGRSGSGKSTLIALLLRLMDPDKGSIFIGDQNISCYSREAIRSRLVTLPQEPWFLPGGCGTVRDNLDPFKDTADKKEIYKVLEKTGLEEQVKAMGGLDADMDQEGGILSSGQRQLFCLARAMLMRRSKLLIMDEATSRYAL
ncbi:ABC transporter integral membrane type 1 [Penicillium canariense]|uniref:ABC transporter integral membrane type 1 n=1 Tax=Penicillium canariense TaxID=189055 RepID=A0A9W9LCK4_9EURO|nr:ABC transporter integral membrane type 1 [Penicillium canariense]KAJ5150816.1 ABC transporter integral membrane type 1 [Penicillium canariense]